MNILPDDYLRTLLESGYERRNLDFKDAFMWDSKTKSWLKETVIRGVLGLINMRGGGQIVIGVAEKEDKTLDFKGLTEVELNSFNDFDAIKGCIDGFSSEPTDFDISRGLYLEKTYTVITVREFDELPTICKKDGEFKDVLRKDDIYARAKKGRPSTIKASELEIREIIQMAVDKEKANLASRGWTRPTSPPVENFYRDQLKDLN